MPRDDDRDSVFNEPDRRAGPAEPDASESKARRVLDRGTSTAHHVYRSGESVYDEPDILPGRPAETIAQDWSCSECGYNLRGLEVGHRCPECGHIELYRPPPPDAESYQTWLRARVAETSEQTGWSVAAAAALLGGVWAVLASLIGQVSQGGGWGGALLMVVFGPAIEETMKIAAAAYVVELRPYLFRRIEHLQLATVGAAAVFAVIENLVYLYVYHPNHTDEFALWRWTVCFALHVACTMIASRGLLGPWRQAIVELRPPRITQGVRMLVLAILLHGTYNGSVLLYEVCVAPLR